MSKYIIISQPFYVVFQTCKDKTGTVWGGNGQKKKKINQPTKEMQSRSDLSYFSKRLHLWRKKCERLFLQILIQVFVTINGIMHRKCTYRHKFTHKAASYYYLCKGNSSTEKCLSLDLNKGHLLDRINTVSLAGTFWFPTNCPKFPCQKAHFSNVEIQSVLSNLQTNTR